MNLSEASAIYLGDKPVTAIFRGAEAAWLFEPLNVFADAVAFWKLDDLADATGNGNTLTNNGSVTFGSGKIGDAANFSGTNYLSSSLAVDTSAITVSCWVKTAVEGAGFESYGFLVWGGDLEYGFFITGEGIVNFDIGGDLWRPSFATPINDNQWHHVVGVADPSTSEVRLYVDGALAAKAGSYEDFSLSSLAATIGSNLAGDFGLQNQSIDAVGIWNRALSSAEIATLYNSGAGLEPT